MARCLIVGFSFASYAIFNTEGKILEVEDYIRPVITDRTGSDNMDLRSDGDAVGHSYHGGGFAQPEFSWLAE
jgi:hypothetical protein